MATQDDNLNDARRPYSIDLSLELEHQLDNESLSPSTPADGNRPQSLDPQVLAHIITELRTSLQEVTRHRDELTHTLSELQAKENDYSSTLAHMTEKCSKLQEELDTANNKATDDENTISLLRSKVEESRRGLMRLQSESRRQSQVPSGLDLSRATFTSFASPPSSKRASFAPLTGSNAGRINAHRRISSVSDSGLITGLVSPHPSPSPATFTFPENPMAKTARLSGLFGRASPPPSLFQSEESVEVEMLRKELNAMRAELDEVKHELSEANEAKEASQLCAKALRSFIEENNVGAQMPSTGGSASMPFASPSSQAEQQKNVPAAGGWGFNFWRNQAAAPVPSSCAVSPSAIPNNPSSPPPQLLSKKFGEFFSARSASISSTTPIKSPRSEPEAMLNGLSDTSSIEESLAEPVSPASELPRPSILVKDTTSVTSASSARDLGVSPEQKVDGLPGEGVFTPVAI